VPFVDQTGYLRNEATRNQAKVATTRLPAKTSKNKDPHLSSSERCEVGRRPWYFAVVGEPLVPVITSSIQFAMLSMGDAYMTGHAATSTILRRDDIRVPMNR
jgi:hypothetical protein